ncbi:MAG: LmeA family phospholipid-binding protein [Acidobacteria bacterium]|nr:LmeA family phospholipid-binding protein [Acidobacteriota bacterium]
MALAVGLYIADSAARRAAESALATVVKERSPGGDVTVDIGGFLFVPPVVAEGRVSSIRVTQSNVAAGRLSLRSVDVELSDVALDRSALVQHQHLEVRKIDHGSVTATIDDAGLSAAAGIRLAIHPDGAVATVPKLGQVRVPVAFRDGSLIVELPGGHQLAVGLPSLPVLPCASGLTLGEGTAELRCEITGVPPALVRSLGSGRAPATASPG